MSNSTKSLPREIGLVGSRPAKDRAWLRRFGMGLVSVGIATAALSSYQAGSSDPNQWALLQGPEQTVQAQVVSKIRQPEGAVLTRGFFNKGQGNAWQPMEDVSTSSYQLVLFIPDEIKPVVVAVSRDIFNDYCNHLQRSDYLPASRTLLNTTFQAGCGDVFGANGRVIRDAPDQLDTVSLSFTRSKLDGSVQVTRLEGQEKLAQNFSEKSVLEQKTQRDLTRNSTPRG